ncbi:MAG: replication initiator protein A, partial [Oscillospiraceae bacterium]
MFKRYTLNDVENNLFFQMPKFLFEGDLKSKLSNDAKVLYSLLRDRHELSIKNGWINEKNEVYLIYTRNDLCDMLGCSQPTLRKALEQLKDFNLMDEERQGLNRPNLIYLNYYYLQSTETTGVKQSFIPEC